MASRLNVLITEEDDNRLDRLTILLGGASRTESVKRSMRITELLLESISSGGTVKIVDKTGKETTLTVV